MGGEGNGVDSEHASKAPWGRDDAHRMAPQAGGRAHRCQGQQRAHGYVPAQRQAAVHGEETDPKGGAVGQQESDQHAQRAAAVQGAIVRSDGVRGCTRVRRGRAGCRSAAASPWLVAAGEKMADATLSSRAAQLPAGAAHPGRGRSVRCAGWPASPGACARWRRHAGGTRLAAALLPCAARRRGRPAQDPAPASLDLCASPGAPAD